ncbi:MAG: hypothetical protein R3D66_04200 [Alphaproteobacteria bacterium]
MNQVVYNFDATDTEMPAYQQLVNDFTFPKIPTDAHKKEELILTLHPGEHNQTKLRTTFAYAGGDRAVMQTTLFKNYDVPGAHEQDGVPLIARIATQRKHRNEKTPQSKLISRKNVKAGDDEYFPLRVMHIFSFLDKHDSRQCQLSGFQASFTGFSNKEGFRNKRLNGKEVGELIGIGLQSEDEITNLEQANALLSTLYKIATSLKSGEEPDYLEHYTTLKEAGFQTDPAFPKGMSL